MNADAAAPAAIVTGGASGIGAATSLALAAAGHRVALVDTDAERAQALARQSAAIVPFRCDIADIDALPGLVADIAQRLGPPRVLVNNAAKGGGGAIETVAADAFDRVFAVSARGSFFLTQAVVPVMAAAGGGAIVNVGSLIAARGVEANSHYAGAKAAMIGFTRAWAQEFASRRITVNAVLPALTDTPMTRAAMALDEIAAKAASIPMGRLAQPSDCADLIVFLASAQARFLTGQVLSPNGAEFTGAL
ncbi:SDR family NAD(P)-dependent oxidoreductase [Novosphingobium sp. BL-52-GroH]|uniref:SDR family NAD(P)-dependent oxidoreductase n=1 Tax=Novosphingobium sp. BL-52-GroH TaxID=3349877 RepID=UPI00384DA9AB